MPFSAADLSQERDEQDQRRADGGGVPEDVEVGQGEGLPVAGIPVPAAPGGRTKAVAGVPEEELRRVEESRTAGLSGSSDSLRRSVWNCSRRSRRVLASEVPTLPPSLRSSARSPTAAPRSCAGCKEGGDVQRGEDHRQPGDDHHARPDDLPRADVEVQPRHPEVPGRHHEQPDGHQPARVDAARRAAMPTMNSMHDGAEPAGESTSPDVVAS